MAGPRPGVAHAGVPTLFTQELTADSNQLIKLFHIRVMKATAPADQA